MSWRPCTERGIIILSYTSINRIEKTELITVELGFHLKALEIVVCVKLLAKNLRASNISDISAKIK